MGTEFVRSASAIYTFDPPWNKDLDIAWCAMFSYIAALMKCGMLCPATVEL